MRATSTAIAIPRATTSVLKARRLRYHPAQTRNGTVVRTRPVFPYPQVARYDGQGSTDDAADFRPSPPPKTYDDGIPWLGSFRSGYEQTCGWRDGRWTCSRTT